MGLDGVDSRLDSGGLSKSSNIQPVRIRVVNFTIIGSKAHLFWRVMKDCGMDSKSTKNNGSSA